MGTKEDYMHLIADRIKNYRKGELNYPLNENHVKRWVQQFDLFEQEVVLKETYNLLTQCYFKKKEVKAFLMELISTTTLWNNDDVLDEIKHTQFLNIQNKGSSQTILLELLNNLLKKNYNIEISTVQNENTTRYLYLDDCLFSGNTLRRDLERWISNANDGSRLDIVFLASYSAGYYYIGNKVLNNLCSSKGIQYQIWFQKQFNNFPQDWYNYDCLWPKAIDNQNISEFICKLQDQASVNGWPIRLFRDREYVSPLFTDAKSREIFEHAMLKAGAYIYSCSANPNTSMKPMGYDFFNSLGFGAFFATFNNISNNSPLAFWWGDPEADTTHPFSKWYPLLPRKVNHDELLAW